MAETAKGLLTKPEVRFWLAVIVIVVGAATAMEALRGRVSALETADDRLEATDIRIETALQKTEPILIDIQTQLARIQAQLELILEGRLGSP